jgi:hypothetical protein
VSTSGTTSTGLSGLTRIELPRHLAEAALTHLKRAGRDGLEGVALWAGQRDGNAFRIQRTIIPEQDATRTEQGLLYVVAGYWVAFRSWCPTSAARALTSPPGRCIGCSRAGTGPT